VRVYRRIWIRATAALVGVACAVLISGAIIRKPVVAGVVLGIGTLAVVVARRQPRVRLPMELTVVLVLVTTIAAVAGLAPLVGNVALLIVLADLLAGLPLVLFAAPTAPHPDDSRRAPDELSTEELCEAWRSSGRALDLHSLSAEHQGRIVTARGRYLDELLRRYPDEMAQWMAAGSPDADPAEFVNPHR